MIERVRLALPALLVPWTALLCWLYLASFWKESLVGALLQRRGNLLAAALAAGLPAVGLWFAEHRWERPSAAWLLLVALGVLAVAIATGAQVLAPLAAAILLVTAAYGIGAGAARWVDLEELRGTWAGAPLLAALGWALLIAVGLAAGAAGLLTRPVIGGACLAGIVAAAFWARRLPATVQRPDRPEDAGPPVFWWWGLAALLLIGLVGAAAPEVRHDALGAHLPIAREFARHGAIVVMRQNAASNYQLNADLLYAMGMLFIPGAVLPKLMHYLSGALASLIIYNLGARLWGARVGLAAAAIVAGTPLVWWAGGTAYTDLWLVLFIAAAVECLVIFAPRQSPGRAMAIGLLAGAALGSKIPGAAWVVPICAVALVWIATSGNRRGRWAMAGALLAGLVVTGAYWYARTWILTGNPVFPLLSDIFKSGHVGPRTERSYLATLGMGRGIVDLLLIPWRVTRYPSSFVEDGTLGVAYLALLPAALLAIVRSRVPRWMVTILVAGGIIWFLTAQYLRFLLPALPLAALAAAAGILADPLPRRAALASAVVLILGIGTAAGSWVMSGPRNFPLSVVRRTVSRDAYTASYIGGFRVAQYASRSLPESARIYGAGEPMSFDYDRFFVSMNWYGNSFDRTLIDLMPRARTGEEVQAILSRAGFTHLVVFRGHPPFARWGRRGSWLGREAFWEEGPWLEHAYREYYLFRLQPASPRLRTRGLDLLSAAGGLPVGVPARVSAGEPLREQVAVRPGALYALEAQLRSTAAEGTARLFIEWLDEDGRGLDDATRREVTVTPQWKRYAMACTAPAEARRARMWLVAVRGPDVEVDRPEFYELR